jgi:hypothetical protein
MTTDTLLYRQVNPNWVASDGRPTSVTFTPFPKDKGKLSVYNGDKWTAEDSFRHFTEKQGYHAVGNMALTVKECLSCGLPATEDNHPYNGHAFIDFTQCSKNEVRTKAKQLKQAAQERDWTYLDR